MIDNHEKSKVFRFQYHTIYVIYRFDSIQFFYIFNYMKWSREEDEQLLQHINKYGTASWNQIQEVFSTRRTKNAIVRRWHANLKDLNGDLDKIHGNPHVETEEVSEQKSRQRSRQNESNKKKSIDQSKNQKDHSDNKLSKLQNERLKNLILKQHQCDWKILAKQFKMTQNQIVNHWQKQIYPEIKNSLKATSGSFNWQPYQDQIIRMCQKKYHNDWAYIRKFLPQRTQYLINQRNKSLSQMKQNKIIIEEIEVRPCLKKDFENKYLHRKDLIRKMAQKYEKN